MKLLDIELKKPKFSSATTAAIFVMVSWLAFVAVGASFGVYTNNSQITMLLLGIAWGVVANEMGIRLREGWRHWVLLFVGATLIMGAAHVLIHFFIE